MRYKKFQETHDEAIDYIKSVLASTKSYDREFVVLANWIMENQDNPYGYLPEHWAGRLDSATGFASFLRNMHHDMVDDGDICFVMVDGRPCIRFLHPGDMCMATIKDYIGEIPADFFRKNGRPLSDITFLDNAESFIAAYKKRQQADTVYMEEYLEDFDQELTEEYLDENTDSKE